MILEDLSQMVLLLEPPGTLPDGLCPPPHLYVLVGTTSAHLQPGIPVGRFLEQTSSWELWLASLSLSWQ